MGEVLGRRLVRKMKQIKFFLGTTIILFNEKLDKVLMMKRNGNKKLSPGAWANIGGKIEWAEYTLDAAVREVWEETGFRIRKKDLRFVTYSERVGHELILIYTAKIKERSPKMTDEHSHAGWFEIKKLPKPRIKDPVQEAKIVLMEKIPRRPFQVTWKSQWKEKK